MPKPHPKEFREDVVRVARDRGPNVSIEQVARDFGIHQTTLNTWLRAADLEESPRSTASPEVLRENRDLKRRNRLLEQENEVLRRAAAYLAQGSLPGKALPAREGVAGTGGGESAKFWMNVLADLKNRGTKDVFFVVWTG